MHVILDKTEKCLIIRFLNEKRKFWSEEGVIRSPIWDHFGTVLSPFWDRDGDHSTPIWGVCHRLSPFVTIWDCFVTVLGPRG